MLKRRPEPLYLAAIALFIFITLLTGILNNAGWIHTIDQQVIAAVIQFHPVTFKPLLNLNHQSRQSSILSFFNHGVRRGVTAQALSLRRTFCSQHGGLDEPR